MKTILTLVFFISSLITLSQSAMPHFLIGTWQVGDNQVFEHWDKLSESSFKGFSYKLRDGKMVVTEYLAIDKTGGDVIYTATVINQNQGQGIRFKLTRADTIFVFENPDHDFPTRISYQNLTDNRVFVQVAGAERKGFEFVMNKHTLAQNTAEKDVANPQYDAALAQRLGADDLGMKTYVLVILKTGANTTTDREFITESFRGHLENINLLAAEKKLVLAGPFLPNDKSMRGIFILNDVSSIEEAKALLQTDPAIRDGLLEAEVFSWYGSAALPEVLDISDRIWKVKP